MKRIRLAARRRTVGLSQEALAEQLGVDRSTVMRWENGERTPQPWQRPNIAMVLKVTAEELDDLLVPGQEPPAQPGQPMHHPLPGKPSAQPVTPYLDALVRCTAYGSLERFASVVWPNLPEGEAAANQHLPPCAATRTLEELGILGRIDMLTRRETLTEAIKAISGPALLAPIARWLDTPPGRLEPGGHGARRIGASDVEAIESSTRFFAVTDADKGGGLSREAAVGQLKYAVDLARHASYSEAVGNRLLAAVAELSGLVGWLSHDSGMAGPAQRYFTYGLQAARESTDPRAKLLVVSILADMGQQMRWIGRPEAALKLHDLAIRQLPQDHSRHRVLLAVLTAKRAENGLAYLGASHLPEARDSLSQAFDLYHHADDEDRATAATYWHRALDMSEAELSMAAASAYMTMAKDDPRLALEAEKHTRAQIAQMPDGQGRARIFSQIRLARLRLLAGEPEQACDDGDQALHLAGSVKSAMVRSKLRELLADSEPYTDVPRVVELRDQLRVAIGRLN